MVQLRNADDASEAARLVSSYVISDKMEDTLTGVIFPQLQFEKSYDPKGMLIVGNYGTGKSHLMSVISAVAERADLAASFTNPKVAVAALAVAGKFKVIRTELATEMDFSDFICSHIEESLAGLGVAYSFPPKDQIKNWKTCFEDMMGKFAVKFPEHGLLLVVDELLDYLRGRDGQAVVRDLNFLRVIGEVCSSLNFRFMAGIQQALFDNPVFSFVSIPFAVCRSVSFRCSSPGTTFATSFLIASCGKTPSSRALFANTSPSSPRFLMAWPSAWTSSSPCFRFILSSSPHLNTFA